MNSILPIGTKTMVQDLVDGVNVAIKKVPLVKKLITWGRKNSLWVVHLTTGCCSPEFAALAGAGYDMERFGPLVMAAMRQCDILIIEGQVADKMAEVVKRTYDQMPDPKYVIAVGNCSISGGFYWDSYSMVMGVDKIIPVDVYVPGCPPRPEDWIDAIRLVQTRMDKEGLDRERPLLVE